MQRVAFKMFLFPGMKQEYKKRHDEIWPELTKLLHDAGIRNYSIHLDEGSNTLFGYLEQKEGHTMDDLPKHPVMQKWWGHMKDVMEYDGDQPRVVTLSEVFFQK